MLSLLVRNVIFFTLLYQFIVLFDVTNAAVEFISNTELVEKYIIDSVPKKDGVSATTVSETSAIQPDAAAVAPQTEEASGPSSMELDIAVSPSTEKAAAPSSSTRQDAPAPPQIEESESTGLCAAAEESKLGFCQIFLQNEILFDFNFERGSANFVCERRKIVLTTLNQSNLNEQDEMNTYRCPRLVQSDLLAEIYDYFVSQVRADSPVVVYTRRNAYSHIHPFKAVLNVDLATLVGTPVSYYPTGQSLLLPMDLSRSTQDANQLLEKARKSIEMKKLTRTYEKFSSFFHSFNVCALRTDEKLFGCKHYIFPRKDEANEYVQMEADVNLYAGSSAYKGSECRRRETVLVEGDENLGLDFGIGVAQFRCPPMARYELQQGTSDGGALQPKIYFDHTVRLMSSHFEPSTAFLLDARYHQVALAATVSGIENKNLEQLAALRRLSRWRRRDHEREGSYEPARLPDQYTPIEFIEMSRDRAEEVIYELKGGHVHLPTHKKFETLFPKISLATYKYAADKVKLCTQVFGHQAFGYEIEAAAMQRKRWFELYVNRLDFRIDDRNKWLQCFLCKPKKATIYADLFVAAGSAKTGGVVVLVRDFKTEVLTPLAVAYPDSESVTAPKTVTSS